MKFDKRSKSDPAVLLAHDNEPTDIHNPPVMTKRVRFSDGSYRDIVPAKDGHGFTIRKLTE